MQRRRALLCDRKRSRLPSGYQETEWLEGGNGSYIELPLLCSEITRVVTAYKSEANNIGTAVGCHSVRPYWCPCLAYNNNNANKGAAFLFDTTWGLSKVPTTSFVNADVLCKAEEYATGNFNGVIINGARVPTKNNKVTLFTSSSRSWQDLLQLKQTLLYGQSDDIICDLVPCYHESDGKPGMYDLCGSICPLTNSPFYINAGTGEFLVGPDVN